jgi:hypothetical protein
MAPLRARNLPGGHGRQKPEFSHFDRFRQIRQHIFQAFPATIGEREAVQLCRQRRWRNAMIVDVEQADCDQSGRSPVKQASAGRHIDPMELAYLTQ